MPAQRATSLSHHPLEVARASSVAVAPHPSTRGTLPTHEPNTRQLNLHTGEKAPDASTAHLSGQAQTSPPPRYASFTPVASGTGAGHVHATVHYDRQSLADKTHEHLCRLIAELQTTNHRLVGLMAQAMPHLSVTSFETIRSEQTAGSEVGSRGWLESLRAAMETHDYGDQQRRAPTSHAHSAHVHAASAEHAVATDAIGGEDVGATSDEEDQYANRTEWEIPFDDIVLGARVGEGTYGEVFKGNWFGDVAVKKLKIAEPTAEDMALFKNEILGLRKTRHRNILQFYGACTTPPNLAIVTAFCDGDSLYEMIHGADVRWTTRLTRDYGKNALQIAHQTITAMRYLHSKCKIIHRDLKSNNIFIEQTDATTSRVQIGDFGLALLKGTQSPASKGEEGKSAQGSVLWMAPEIIKMKPGEEAYTEQSDVWAFGIIVFEMFSQNHGP